MPNLPDYVSDDRAVEVTVEKPNGSTETFNSRYEYIVFIDVRDEGVWIRDENNKNTFYPSSQIMELKLPSNNSTISENLQKQRRS